MKKYVKTFCLLAFCFMLVACGGKPSDMSDNAYEVGEKVLETTTQYLDGDINGADAIKKIDTLTRQIEINPDFKKDSKLNLLCSQIFVAINDSSQKDVLNLKQELNDMLNK